MPYSVKQSAIFMDKIAKNNTTAIKGKALHLECFTWVCGHISTYFALPLVECISSCNNTSYREIHMGIMVTPARLAQKHLPPGVTWHLPLLLLICEYKFAKDTNKVVTTLNNFIIPEWSYCISQT